MENVISTEESKVKKTARQFSKFVLVGVMNTLVDLIVLNTETIITGSKEGGGYAVQKGFSFLVAVIFSYIMNKNWTFQDRSEEHQTRKFSQFLFVSIIGMLINVTTATVVVTYIKPFVNDAVNIALLTDQLWVNIGALSGTAVGLIWNFAGYKFLVFKK